MKTKLLHFGQPGASFFIGVLLVILALPTTHAGNGGSVFITSQQQNQLAGESIISDGYVIEVVTPETAEKFRANYETYINGLPDRSTNLFFVDMNLALLDAIRKQSRIMNSEPGQESIRIVYGIKDLSAAKENRQYVEMIYPLNSRNQTLPFTSGKVYIVQMPTIAELRAPRDAAASGELSNLRGVLNCPPYCD